MRKINQKVAMEQEAFNYYNEVEEELKPFWEEADEMFQVRACIRDWDEDWFYENQLRQYEKEHFTGKRWEEVDPMVKDIWSDLYKDVRGIRPRHIPFECIA